MYNVHGEVILTAIEWTKFKVTIYWLASFSVGDAVAMCHQMSWTILPAVYYPWYMV
jgi:hypothetical protein